MAVALPEFVPSSFDDVCQRIERVAPPSRSGPALVQALKSFALSVEDEHAEALDLLMYDASDMPASLDDEDLAEWWSNDCWIRSVLWSITADGRTSALDWLMWMLTFAERGGTPRLSSLLAADLRDMSRVAFRAGCGSKSELQLVSHRSPVRVFQWLAANGIDIATSAGSAARPAGSVRVTRAWLDGDEAQEGHEFDALIHTCARGGTAFVVELDHGFRRHVLVPIGSLNPDEIDADQYCIDLLRRRGGWMSRLGVWIWDDAPADSLPPLASLPEVLENRALL